VTHDFLRYINILTYLLTCPNFTKFSVRVIRDLGSIDL